MATALSTLQHTRTHNNDSPRRHQRAQSDVPQTPHTQENRLDNKFSVLRGRSNSVVLPQRKPLRELSPSERNESPERREQPISPLLRLEMEEEAQRAAQWEQDEQDEQDELDELDEIEARQERGTPSATYTKSPFPLHPSQILLPSPTTRPSFIFQPPQELSAGTSDAPDYFTSFAPEPLATEDKWNSTDTDGSSSDDDELSLAFNPRASSDLYGSVNSRNSMMQSTIRSIQPSDDEEFEPSTTSLHSSARSSASSETLSTRCHEGRQSTGSNWTLHAPMSASTRPTSINTRTPSPFGVSTPRTPLFGPRSAGVSKDKRPVSTFGNPMSPYLESGSDSRPLSTCGTYSGQMSDFDSSDQLLDEIRTPAPSAQRKYQATVSSDTQYPEVGSVSGMSSTTGDNEPAPLRIPKKVAMPNDRQLWTSTQSQAVSRLQTIPSSPQSMTPPESSARNTAESLVSLPSMHFDGSLPSPRRHTQDKGEESSAQAAARPVLPPIRNPWSTDSTSFFNLMMGRDNDGARDRSGSTSRPTTGGSRSSSATVLYMAKGLPTWARYVEGSLADEVQTDLLKLRSFYSTGDPSVLGSSSRPSTRSKPSNSSLRHAVTHGSTNSISCGRTNKHSSRPASSSRPANTAPSESPASSEFSIASIRRPRNRPRTIYSENWSPNLAADTNSDSEDDNESNDDADDDDNYDTYSAGIEPHQPSTAHTNRPPLSITDIPTQTDANTNRSNSDSTDNRGTTRHYRRPLRPFGPAGTASNETPRLHRDYQSSTFRCLRASSWMVGSSSRDDEDEDGGRGLVRAAKAADRQMWLFCLGFLMPFAWVVGALLGVPIDGKWSSGGEGGRSEKGKKRSRRARTVETEDGSGGVVDVEAQMRGSAVAARWEKERVRAVWWRMVNRRMSIVGMAVLVVAVVVAVVVSVT